MKKLTKVEIQKLVGSILFVLLLIALGVFFIANSSLSMNLTNEFTKKVEEPVRSAPTWHKCPDVNYNGPTVNGICYGTWRPTITFAQEINKCTAAKGTWYDYRDDLDFKRHAYTCQMEQIPGVITIPKEDETSKGRKTFIQFVSVIIIIVAIFLFALAFYVMMPNSFKWKQNVDNKLRNFIFPQPAAQ